MKKTVYNTDAFSKIHNCIFKITYPLCKNVEIIIYTLNEKQNSINKEK